jgi:hypothetical protein
VPFVVLAFPIIPNLQAKDKADIAVNITLHALDGEALSDDGLHLANRTTFS